MIKCSNQACEFGSWFHLECFGLELETYSDKDWWCSIDCRDTGNSTFCKCRKLKQDTMVTCSEKTCENGQYFHLSCVFLEEKPGMCTVYKMSCNHLFINFQMYHPIIICYTCCLVAIKI